MNYTSLAEDGIKFMAAHYRQWDAHQAGCEWLSEEEAQDTGEVDGADPEKNGSSRRKLSDLVNVFDPSLSEEEASQIHLAAEVSKSLDFFDRADDNRLETTLSSESGDIKTNSLERLVETYREAKSILLPEEFKALEIKIVRLGQIKLTDYFRHLQYASGKTTQRVIFGGATLVKRYGMGFSFRFYDKLDGMPVTFYIRKEQMEAYRFRKYIDLVLSKHAEVKYFTLYAIGNLVATPDRGFDLVVADLRHLVITLGPFKVDY